MRLMGQFFMLPMTIFRYGMDMFMNAMQGMRAMTDHGAGVVVAPRMPASGSFAPVAPEIKPPDFTADRPNSGSTRIKNEEEKPLNENTNFCKPNNDGGKCLVLWRYKVLFIKRDLEHAFAEDEDLISDDVQDITAWKIAEFIQKLGQRVIKVPPAWINKRKGPLEYWRISDEDEPPVSYEAAYKAYRDGDDVWLIGLPEDDKRHLRLYSQELARYTRQDTTYEEDQIKVLEQIRDNLAVKNQPVRGGPPAKP